MHFWPKKINVYAIRQRTNVLFMLTLGRTCKFIPPPWYKGGGWKPPPPRVFDMLQYFETMKAVNGGTAGGGCDVINNGHHLG